MSRNTRALRCLIPMLSLCLTFTACGGDEGGATTGGGGVAQDASANDASGGADGGAGSDTTSEDAGSTSGDATTGGDVGGDGASVSDAGGDTSGSGDTSGDVAVEEDTGTTPDTTEAPYSCKGSFSCKVYQDNGGMKECAQDSGCVAGNNKCVPANDSAAGICAKMKSKTSCAQAEKDGIGCKWSTKGCYLLNYCNPHKTQNSCVGETKIPCKWAPTTCTGTSKKLFCSGAPDQKACLQAVPYGCKWSNCVPTNGGKEICDGLDNDCDGYTDDAIGLQGAKIIAKSLCDDGDVCNGSEKCVKGKCQAGAPAKCLNKPCNTVACVKGKGCQYTPQDSGTCDDGDACTTGETCAKGACGGGKAKECGDACTTATCDAKTGQCGKAVAKKCDDGNPCTTDSCDKAKGCVATPLNAGACADGDKCMDNKTCKAGKCQGGTAKSCDDGNACTKGSCDPAKGCQQGQVVGACTDGNICTSDGTCSKGACVGIKSKCDDGNGCTNDACDSKTGTCTNTPAPGCNWKGVKYFYKFSKQGQRNVVGIDIAKDQSVYVAANDTMTSKVPTRLRRYNAWGTKVFGDKTYFAVYSNIARGMAILHDMVYVGAQTKPIFNNNNQCAYLMQIQQGGMTQKWAKQEWFDKPTNTNWGAAWGLAEAPGSDVYVGGYGLNKNGYRSGFVARYVANGQKKWRANFGNLKGDFNLTGLAANSAGTRVVAIGSVKGDLDGSGINKPAGGGDIYLRIYDDKGKHLHTKQFGSTGDDWGRKVKIAKDGTIWWVGATQGNLPGTTALGGRDGLIGSGDPNGNFKTIERVGTKHTDFLYDMDLTPAGDVVAAGNYSNNGVLLVKVGAKDGKKLWQKAWTVNGGSGAGNAVAAAPNGDVLVGGWSNNAIAGVSQPSGYHLFLFRVNGSDGAIFK